METRTAELVAKELRALGFEVKTGIAKTGVVGILKNGEGPTVIHLPRGQGQDADRDHERFLATFSERSRADRTIE